MRKLRITRKTDREKESLKGRLHPLLDPFLNRNHHFDYAPNFSECARLPFVNENLGKLFEMSGSKGRPLLCTSEENSRTAREIVENHFVDVAISTNVNKNRNLVTSLRAIMIEAGLDKEKVENTLSTFDPAATVNEYQSRNQNAHLIKAKGFPSFLAFRAFVEENRDKARKSWEMEMTPRVMTANIKANDDFFSDNARESFLSNLRKWVALVEIEDGPDAATPSSSSPNNDEGEQTLLTIRQNVLKNATLRLASEQQLFTRSLEEYAAAGDDGTGLLPKRVFPAKTCAKFLKIAGATKALEIDLSKPELCEVPLAFHCGHCPSMAKTTKSPSEDGGKKRKRNDGDEDDDDNYGIDDDSSDEEGSSRRTAKRRKRNRPVFVSPSLGRFNVLKAQPIDSLDDFLRHNAQVHRVGDPHATAAKTCGHPYCIMCRFCDPAQHLKDAFVCCLGKSESVAFDRGTVYYLVSR